jgi:SRSO17 transposase
LIGDDTGFPKMSRLSAVVGVKKLRWRIARDDQDIQQELGLGHCEG